MKFLLLVASVCFLVRGWSGTLIGNGRWTDHDSRVNWKISDRWTGFYEGRRVLLSRRDELKNSPYSSRVYLTIRDLEGSDDLESYTRRSFSNSPFSPYSVGLLAGFKSESTKTAGDPLNPHTISRFTFQNPCRTDQVFEVSVQEWVAGSSSPAEYLSGLNCLDPIRE